jgi:hypothetical protein
MEAAGRPLRLRAGLLLLLQLAASHPAVPFALVGDMAVVWVLFSWARLAAGSSLLR